MDVMPWPWCCCHTCPYLHNIFDHWVCCAAKEPFIILALAGHKLSVCEDRPIYKLEIQEVVVEVAAVVVLSSHNATGLSLCPHSTRLSILVLLYL